MKTIMAMLLAVGLALGAVGGAAGADAALNDAPGNRMGLGLLHQLNDGTKNRFVSPVSLGYALSMAALGAKGDTARELLAAAGIDSAEDMAALNAPLRAAGLRWANAAFLREDLAVKQDYIDGLTDHFEAERFALRDAAAVNAWVDQHTDHLIDHLVDDIDPEVCLALVNAVAMDAKWAHMFDPFETAEDVFHAPGGDVTVEYLRDTFEMDYGESALGQAIRLNYRDSGLYLLALLPGEGGLDAALDALAADCDGCFQGMEAREVALSLPKLDVTTSNDLSDALRALGIERAFSDAADFSGISDEPLYVSDVLQKVRVQLDEEGTKAAAATAVIAVNKAMPMDQEPPIELRFDRPFALLIADSATGAVCFAGAVCDPTQN